MRYGSNHKESILHLMKMDVLDSTKAIWVTNTRAEIKATTYEQVRTFKHESNLSSKTVWFFFLV